MATMGDTNLLDEHAVHCM